MAAWRRCMAEIAEPGADRHTDALQKYIDQAHDAAVR
jgi:hypothetical protein